MYLFKKQRRIDIYWHFFDKFFIALSQKTSVEEAPSKRSSLKSTTKTIPIPSTVPQTLANASKRNTMSTQCSYDSVPDQDNSRGHHTFDIFSIFVLILIVALIFLIIYLLGELYVLRNKQSESIQLDKSLLDQLSG